MSETFKRFIDILAISFLAGTGIVMLVVIWIKAPLAFIPLFGIAAVIWLARRY